MGRMAWAVALLGLLGRAYAAGAISRGPRELGEVMLSEVSLKEGKLTIRLDSGGCTSRSSIRAEVRKTGELEGVPLHVVTFQRVGIDECKAIVDEGLLLEYDVAADLGITGLGMLSVANPVLPRTQSSIVDEFSLRRALKESTIRAAELEIRGYEDREKTAREGVGPSGNAERFHQRAEELKARLAALRGAHLNDYPSPASGPQPEAVFLEQDEGHGPLLPARKVTLRVDVKGPCTPGSLLDAEGTSRSGPFYHVAGGALDRLKPGRTHEVTAYLVFRREYFGRMADYYVHVAEVK